MGSWKALLPFRFALVWTLKWQSFQSTSDSLSKLHRHSICSEAKIGVRNSSFSRDYFSFFDASNAIFAPGTDRMLLSTLTRWSGQTAGISGGYDDSHKLRIDFYLSIFMWFFLLSNLGRKSPSSFGIFFPSLRHRGNYEFSWFSFHYHIGNAFDEIMLSPSIAGIINHAWHLDLSYVRVQWALGCRSFSRDVQNYLKENTGKKASFFKFIILIPILNRLPQTKTKCEDTTKPNLSTMITLSQFYFHK